MGIVNAGMIEVYDMYAPLWQALTPEASYKVRKGNYERIFDAARKRVRALVFGPILLSP